ncbi:MAG: leucine--tRNA ligase [Candidatus Aenigmatarchaeota archaeon]
MKQPFFGKKGSLASKETCSWRKFMTDNIKMADIEKKWQKKWLDEGVFEADVSDKKKFFVTFPYPYVNSSPHVGHGYTFLKCDLIARFKRMMGYNVLFAQGFHATGEPIVGAAKRIANGEETQIAAFKKLGLDDAMIEKMTDPQIIVEYFVKEWIKDLKGIGGAIDWRRTFFTTKLNPCYNRFVTWQYETLRKLGYVDKGTHPVIWCPNDKSPTGSHDRLEGENANILEYIVIKFKLDIDNDEYIIPAATLRPETTYGVVNMWVKPDIEYTKADVDGEKWIASKSCLEKLSEQKHSVKILGTIKSNKLIGKSVTNPVSAVEAMMLPANFVDLNNATGIVMSVPTHAPYDYMALEEIQSGKKEAFGADIDDVRKIKPIVLIKTEGLAENPAKAICKDMKIKSQNDKNLELATKMIYRAEFHKGVLNENCGRYAGKSVKDAKDRIVEDFTKAGHAIIMHETSEDVVCRCTTKCFVKIIENQWFLRYSDEKWKNKTITALEHCKVWPDEARSWMEHAVMNMKDKACARTSGLGTPLPWDKEWIVEPLSDSTIYMAYYIIAKYVNNKTLSEKNMTNEFFEYVLLGKDIANASKTSGLKERVLKEIRDELNYFYPVDIRSSGKDLLSHHLIFYLYHHVAFFSKEKWPKGIAANGWITVDGLKMSKSKGNFVSMAEAIEKYSADGSRLAFLDSYSGLDDVNFGRESAEQYKKKLEEFLVGALEILKNSKKKNKALAEKWLLSKTQGYIKAATGALENMDNGVAFNNIFWGLYTDLNKYMSKNDCHKETLKYALETFAKMMSPFAPHFAEELWSRLGNATFACTNKWPVPDERLIDKEAEGSEDVVKNVLADIRDVRKLVKFEPKRLTIFVAQNWRFKVHELARDKDQPGVVKEMGSEMRLHGKDIIAYIQKLKRSRNDVLTKESQLKILEERKSDLEKETGLKVIIIDGDESKEVKATTALPEKPGLLLQ